MIFSSLFFLTVFLPMVLISCWGMRALTSYLVLRRQRRDLATFTDGGKEETLPQRSEGASWSSVNALLLFYSLIFYFWGEGLGVLWLIGSVVVNHLLAVAIYKLGDKTREKKTLLVIAVVANLSFLGWFKYAGFAAKVANSVIGGIIPVPEIALPLGISFYTFQAMSYVCDVYRGGVVPARSIVDFGCYVTMFPQLVAGPIVRYSDIAEKLVSRNITLEDVSYGFRRFLYGLAKKVLIANSVAPIADEVWKLASNGVGMNPVMAWLGVICYTLQIYYDFSGYSDMAIGMGRMLGFKFNENFVYPYCANSIRDFWRRWHISLSTWFRDYLYIPLGGSRRGKYRTGLNCLIVFGLCGLWHGAGVMFLLWGLWHGAFLMLERICFEKDKNLDQAKKSPLLISLLKHLYTKAVFIFGWILFRSESFSEMSVVLQSMFGRCEVMPEAQILWMECSLKLMIAMVVGIVLSYPFVPTLKRWLDGKMNGNLQYAMEWLWLTILGLFSVLFIAGGSYNPFLYFRF